MLSPEGRCKTLDASADGYVRAEAAGIILLQALDLQQPGIAPLAVLAGSSVNQDGRSSSLTAPNGPAQQELLRVALADAGMVPDSLTGLSMHGTGTSLGATLLLMVARYMFKLNSYTGIHPSWCLSLAVSRCARCVLLRAQVVIH
jgi:acyl transferase domain-containing protein